VIWVEWHSSAMRDESGRVISILSLAQDVSSRIQAEERLQYMATHDGLTALPNKVLLNDRLEGALARAHRGRTRVGVMFLDLDHFKDVNDTLGHRVGDLLLKEVSRRIRATLRQSDLLARISGDEFVVVLEDLPDEGAPELVAHKILEEVRRPFQVEGHEIHVSGSLGLALYPEDGGDAETLLKNADAAMYHAKELGRNAFRMFSVELGERRAHRMRVEKALRRALRDDELQLHFQPIMDVASGRVTRAEALLRWPGPRSRAGDARGLHPARRGDGAGPRGRPMGARGRVQAGARVARRRDRRDRVVREPVGEPAARRGAGRGPEEAPRPHRVRAHLAGIRDHRDQHGARRGGREPHAGESCALSACASRSTTSAPATRACRTCATCPSTC
jgi:diguanylate cyclase (GGDEF)-like protein